MRKYIKTELLSIVEQLNKANDVLQKNAGVLSEEQVASVMSECQQSAIAMGNRIESLEGEGTETVRLLEEYCELVYFLTFNWKQQSVKIEKKIRILLNKISNSIRYDLPDSKREVVFLPYKAAMWDSMESVWLAAREDKSCESYVIPIPYFDKNPDGTLKEVHYEGDLYPDYVPITNYNDYDFRERRPDVIFIHNPYDEWNHVTSVHPFFYSKNLKQFTDKLVYIPYFVTGGKLNAMQKLLPSYFYVDYIIAQSAQQKSLFASEILSKVHTLGSPKFDKVINQVVRYDDIPREWKEKLRKKVLFLNAGIDGILKNDENSLLKIQYLTELVKEEDITLLWRPHPLLESTIQSMRPELWELYQDTVEKFQKLSNGILDDTENLELAISLSDAYLGEPTSSVSHLFGVLGKPLFFIQQKILSEDKTVDNVKISCCTQDIQDKNAIWASIANRNGLIKISEAGNVEEFYFIPNERDGSNLYSDILLVDGRLYLVPRNAKEIAVFDIERKVFAKFSVSIPQMKEKFNKGYYFQEKIFCIPRQYRSIVILDCKDGTISYDSFAVNGMKDITGIEHIFSSANSSQLCGDSIFIAAPNKPYLMEYHLKDNTYVMHEIEETTVGFCCMAIEGDNVILGSMQGCEVVIWNLKTQVSHVIKQFPIGWDTQEKISFWDIVCRKEYAYIFPRTNRMILKLSLLDFSLTAVPKEFPFSIEDRRSSFYNHPNHFLMVKTLQSGKIYLQDANRHGISEFTENETFLWKKVELTEEEEVRALAKSFARVGENLPWGVYETKHYSVRRMIHYIQRNMHDINKQKMAFETVAVNLDGTAGLKIYELVKQ